MITNKFADLVFLLSLLSATAQAADSNGSFALEGAGQASCSSFVDAMNTRSTDVVLFSGWLQGYLTGVNRYESAVYDIATWPTQEQQLQFLLSVCRSNTGVRFFDAVGVMVDQLREYQLLEEEELIVIGTLPNRAQLTLYPSTIKLMRKRLNALILADFSLPVSGVWDDELQEAVLAYQQGVGLPATGLPDPDTLLRLFRD